MGDARFNEGKGRTEEKGRQNMGNKKSMKTTSMGAEPFPSNVHD